MGPSLRPTPPGRWEMWKSWADCTDSVGRECSIPIPEGSDAFPQFSRNGQKQCFLLGWETTVVCSSELSSEPLWREYILTSSQPGVFSYLPCGSFPSLVGTYQFWWRFFSPSPTCPTSSSYPAEVFSFATVSSSSTHANTLHSLPIVQYLLLMLVCTCPTGKKDPLFFPNQQPINQDRRRQAQIYPVSKG